MEIEPWRRGKGSLDTREGSYGHVEKGPLDTWKRRRTQWTWNPRQVGRLGSEGPVFEILRVEIVEVPKLDAEGELKTRGKMKWKPLTCGK